jgi:sortase A
MRDKRPVDELSIEELERILAIRKREARQARLRRYQNSGRRVVTPDDVEDVEDTDGAPVVDVETQQISEPEAVETAPSPAPTAAPPEPAPPDYDDGTPHFEDELDRRARGGVSGPPSSLKKVLWNRLLLLVEVAAALGLVLLLVILFQSIQELTQTTADIQAQYQATANARLVPPTATPLINVVAVLPVGHKVTVNDQGDVIGAVFNLDEVPAQYRDQYQAQLTQPLVQPTPSPEGPIRIRIPKIRVDSPVVIGDDWQTLQLGVGYHVGSANPGQVGNMILSAHNDVYGEIFRYLDQLEPGDQVVVSSTTREYTYVVDERQIVRPTDTWVMQSRGDAKQLTLISCYPYRVDNRRIVVFATLHAP